LRQRLRERCHESTAASAAAADSADKPSRPRREHCEITGAMPVRAPPSRAPPPRTSDGVSKGEWEEGVARGNGKESGGSSRGGG